MIVSMGLLSSPQCCLRLPRNSHMTHPQKESDVAHQPVWAPPWSPPPAACRPAPTRHPGSTPTESRLQNAMRPQSSAAKIASAAWYPPCKGRHGCRETRACRLLAVLPLISTGMANTGTQQMYHPSAKRPAGCPPAGTPGPGPSTPCVSRISMRWMPNLAKPAATQRWSTRNNQLRSRISVQCMPKLGNAGGGTDVGTPHPPEWSLFLNLSSDRRRMDAYGETGRRKT